MSYKEGGDFAEQMITEHPEVDGIFINTDMVAIGAITRLKSMSVNIPEDVSIVGFSNWFMSSAISPSLTTINQPGYEMGKESFKRLYKEMKSIKSGTKKPPVIKTLKTSLVKRESTK